MIGVVVVALAIIIIVPALIEIACWALGLLEGKAK